ncbi:hypothetical protein ACFOOK_02730 [Micromonospora krabiensis]|nr:hypothetical protein [Micromonospora krabiensis]
MSNQMGVRLVHNLTHPGDMVVDLAHGPQLARAIIVARRRSHLPARQLGWGREAATLIVTAWPPADGRPPAEFFEACRGALLPGGCVAVLLPHGDPVLPVDVVIAAKQAGLGYLQHIVAAHRPPRRGDHTQFDIHTDVLIMTRSATGNSGTDG